MSAALVGSAALVASLVASGAAVVVGGWGVVDPRPAGATHAVRLLTVSAAALVVGLVTLAWAFATSDFSLVAVADNSRRDAAAPLRLAGLWAGLEGSLLLWATLVAVAGAWTLRRTVARLRPRVAAQAVALVSLLVAGTTAVVVWLAPPFARLGIPSVDGRGVVPILDDPAMLVHPPLLYLSEALLVPVFVLGLLGLAEGSGRWTVSIRRVALAAWSLLTVALLLGAHWAYDEVGWGGYWAWDPVENSGLLPWIAVTLLVHATRRPSASPRQIGVFALLPLVLALAGAVLTRSGATTSVHAFAEAPDVGRGLGLVVAAVVASAAISLFVAPRAERRTDGQVGLLDLQQVLGGAVLVVVAAGTAWPVLMADGRSVEGTFYAGLAGPLVAVALVLAGLAGDRRLRFVQALVALVTATLVVLAGWVEPLGVVLAAAAMSTAAGAIGGALIDRLEGPAPPLRARLGSQIGHLGFGLLMLGVAGSTAGTSTVGTLAPGESMEVAGVAVRLDDLRVVEPRPGVEGVAVQVDLSGRTSGQVVARLDVHRDVGVVLPETGRRSGWRQDVQVVLRDADDDRAVLQVNVLPLVRFVWTGGLLIALGGAVALLASLDRTRIRLEPVLVSAHGRRDHDR